MSSSINLSIRHSPYRNYATPSIIITLHPASQLRCALHHSYPFFCTTA
ncbi:MAG: hypothetical protein Q4F47_02835 [Bacteroidaceae bacterium]|nr:hypothetical protein [Bacteroidaceae bacterium]